MTPEAVSYNVVILGAMNPLIHSTGWYKLVGILDDDEFDEAVSSQNTVCLPPFARVHTQDLVITCQSERWEVLTSRLDRTDRLGDITTKVFDELLKQTPVRAIGFNFIYRIKLAKDAGEAISKGLHKTGVKVDWDKIKASDFSVTTEQDNHSEKVSIQPTKAKHSLAISTNFQYDIKSSDADKTGYFELGTLIKENYSKTRDRSLEISQDYIKSLS